MSCVLHVVIIILKLALDLDIENCKTYVSVLWYASNTFLNGYILKTRECPSPSSQ